VLKQAFFFPVFFRTVLWTAINILFHVAGGLGLALLLNRPMRGKGIYRTLIILPWAIPQVIAALAWRGEFNYEFGFVNLMLGKVGISPIQWLTAPGWNFVAMCIVNIWLGIPFMMVILLGGLQSISQEYYEAAEIDGASSFQQFRNITMPLLQPVMTPAIILGTIWTFNNFNIPFFINQNELETSDILVTALFRAAFQYNRYGFAAAFAFVIFIVLLLYSIFYIRFTGALKEADQ
jgi:arabinogalactan oligomer/maltooligosaccharide transport system permease protein